MNKLNMHMKNMGTKSIVSAFAEMSQHGIGGK